MSVKGILSGSRNGRWRVNSCLEGLPLAKAPVRVGLRRFALDVGEPLSHTHPSPAWPGFAAAARRRGGEARLPSGSPYRSPSAPAG